MVSCGMTSYIPGEIPSFSFLFFGLLERHVCSFRTRDLVLRQPGANLTLSASEQTDRVIARNFIQVLNGTSKYATYY